MYLMYMYIYIYINIFYTCAVILTVSSIVGVWDPRMHYKF